MANHIVGFSGGAASSVCAKIVADKHDNTTLLFHNTNTEPKDNDRFRAEVAEFLSLPITDDSDGRNIWQVFEAAGYLGNGRNTMCSRILKRERALAYCKSHKPAIIYIGFTIEERHRVMNVELNYAEIGVEARFPLIEQKIGKEECLHRVENCWGLKLPKIYEWANHANCIPCIKGKKAYWGLIYMFEREAWERTVQAEKNFGKTIFTEAGSLTDELDNCLRLAKNYLEKKKAERMQTELFTFPCSECAI